MTLSALPTSSDKHVIMLEVKVYPLQINVYMYMYVEHSIVYTWVCCVALPCCLFDLACFFLPSFSRLSLKRACTCMYIGSLCIVIQLCQLSNIGDCDTRPHNGDWFR